MREYVVAVGGTQHIVKRDSDGKFIMPDALRWIKGHSVALKPAFEPIVVARKPLSEKTVAANVLKWGTGALNINGCRVESGEALGRWPANIVHDGSDEVLGAFPDAPGQQQNVALDAPSARTGNIYGKMNRHGEKSADSRYTDKGSTNFAALPGMRRGDAGSAARFFYNAKADSDDRVASKHPTVKPVDLMAYLVRLVTPKGGTVLDPLAGTGTTGEGAFREGMNSILIEKHPEYQADIRRRMALTSSGPSERAWETAKVREADDNGPLFSQI